MITHGTFQIVCLLRSKHHTVHAIAVWLGQDKATVKAICKAYDRENIAECYNLIK